MKLQQFRSKTQVFLEGEQNPYVETFQVNASCGAGIVKDIELVKGIGVIVIREGTLSDILITDGGAGKLKEKYVPVPPQAKK